MKTHHKRTGLATVLLVSGGLAVASLGLAGTASADPGSGLGDILGGGGSGGAGGLLSKMDELQPIIDAVKDDPKQATPPHTLFKGDYLQPQEVVGARVLGILLPEGTPEDPITIPNPRTKLADSDLGLRRLEVGPLHHRYLDGCVVELRFALGPEPALLTLLMLGVAPAHAIAPAFGRLVSVDASHSRNLTLATDEAGPG